MGGRRALKTEALICFEHQRRFPRQRTKSGQEHPREAADSSAEIQGDWDQGGLAEGKPSVAWLSGLVRGCPQGF